MKCDFAIFHHVMKNTRKTIATRDFCYFCYSWHDGKNR